MFDKKGYPIFVGATIVDHNREIGSRVGYVSAIAENGEVFTQYFRDNARLRYKPEELERSIVADFRIDSR